MKYTYIFFKKCKKEENENIIVIKSVTLRKMRKMGLENNRQLQQNWYYSRSQVGRWVYRYFIIDNGDWMRTKRSLYNVSQIHNIWIYLFTANLITSLHMYWKSLRADTLKLRILKSISRYSQKPEKIEEHEFLITHQNDYVIFTPRPARKTYS